MSELEKAKLEYERKGGKITVLPPEEDQEKGKNPYFYRPKDFSQYYPEEEDYEVD